MNKQPYNILFHLHTVSGIVITVLLFVIFFAGSFSFFRDEIVNWERNVAGTRTDIQLDFDKALDSIQVNHELYGRNLSIYQYFEEQKVNVSLEPSQDSLADNKAKQPSFFYLDTNTYKEESYIDTYTLGEFLYRLHFFAQIPYPVGYYLSGFVAFFFLFAILTGTLVHWKKIVSNFFIFRPWAKLKTIWTDAHTALGMIGFPFQFVYAVTGAFFMINLIFAAPMAALLYNGDTSKLYDDLESSTRSFEFRNSKIATPVHLNEFLQKAKEEWKDFAVTKVDIQNYGDANMHVSIEGQVPPETHLASLGKIIYKASTGEIVYKKDPYNGISYIEAVRSLLYKLHYGDYGGPFLRIISFILGIITCFVILSGVMIWLTARDKKIVSPAKRRFNTWTGRIYFSICLSMYPITALSFIAVKLFAPAGETFIYSFYFIGWLILTLLFLLKRDNVFTTKFTLLSGGIFGLMVPVANGIITNNWIWQSFQNDSTDVFMVDLMWIIIGCLTIYASFRIRRNENKDVSIQAIKKPKILRPAQKLQKS